MNLARLENGRGRAGMTLIELLIVMGLVAMILGVGLGALAGIDTGSGPAVALVNSSLRSANNWAVARRAPARVVFNADENTIRAEGLAVIGTWHFEHDPPRGAFTLNGSYEGVSLTDDGYLGKALDLEGAEEGGLYTVPVHASSTYDLSSGFHVAFAAKPVGEGSAQVLAIGESLGIELTAAGEVKAWFHGERRDENLLPIRTGKVLVKSSPGLLRVGNWSRILVSYDRRELAVFVEGVPVGRTSDEAYVTKVTGPLVIGAPRKQWPGRIDSVVISAVAAEDVVELPEGVSFAETAPKEVVFSAGGGLDRRAHAEPVRFGLDFSDGRSEQIEVGVYGTVQ
jgi:prepilin-type N-terminal cleavage/methylation domain-containing protein